MKLTILRFASVVLQMSKCRRGGGKSNTYFEVCLSRPNVEGAEESQTLILRCANQGLIHRLKKNNIGQELNSLYIYIYAGTR